MSYAESEAALVGTVARRAGFAYAYSLQVILASEAATTRTLTSDDQRLVCYDATGNGTIVLPAQPDDFMEFELCEQKGGTGTLTVDGNGHLINGSSAWSSNQAYKRTIFRFVPASLTAAAQWGAY